MHSGKPSLVTGAGLEAAAATLGAEIGPLIAVPLVWPRPQAAASARSACCGAI